MMGDKKDTELNQIVTVKQMIQILLEYPMDSEVICKHKGKRLKDVEIVAKHNPNVMGVLFG